MLLIKSNNGAKNLHRLSSVSYTHLEYRVGDPIRVKVINANVNSGKIDFALADED